MFKTIAIALVYAPLYPFAYLIAAMSLTIGFLCNKFCISFWWKRPSSIDDDIAAKLRRFLAYLLFLQVEGGGRWREVAGGGGRWREVV